MRSRLHHTQRRKKIQIQKTRLVHRVLLVNSKWTLMVQKKEAPGRQKSDAQARFLNIGTRNELEAGVGFKKMH